MFGTYFGQPYYAQIYPLTFYSSLYDPSSYSIAGVDSFLFIAEPGDKVLPVVVGSYSIAGASTNLIHGGAYPSPKKLYSIFKIEEIKYSTFKLL